LLGKGQSFRLSITWYGTFWCKGQHFTLLTVTWDGTLLGEGQSFRLSITWDGLLCGNG